MLRAVGCRTKQILCNKSRKICCDNKRLAFASLLFFRTSLQIDDKRCETNMIQNGFNFVTYLYLFISISNFVLSTCQGL